jgi:SAM-dependent methyltransferase
MDIKEQDILGDRIGNHWYYRAKAAAMQHLLAGHAVRNVLDVGAGVGFFSRVLLENGAQQATCVDPAYERTYTATHAGKPIHFVHNVTETTADTMLLMDVLEHVDDDIALLAEYANLAAPGARILITVPAFQFMWSGHDVFLEHRRRYTLAGLERVVRATGLRPITGCYYYALTLPLAAATRLAQRALGADQATPRSDLRVHSPLVNAALFTLCRLELPWFRANKVAGLSVCFLAEKA